MSKQSDYLYWRAKQRHRIYSARPAQSKFTVRSNAQGKGQLHLKTGKIVHDVHIETVFNHRVSR